MSAPACHDWQPTLAPLDPPDGPESRLLRGQNGRALQLPAGLLRLGALVPGGLAKHGATRVPSHAHGTAPSSPSDSSSIARSPALMLEPLSPSPSLCRLA